MSPTTSMLPSSTRRASLVQLKAQSLHVMPTGTWRRLWAPPKVWVGEPELQRSSGRPSVPSAMLPRFWMLKHTTRALAWVAPRTRTMPLLPNITTTPIHPSLTTTTTTGVIIDHLTCYRPMVDARVTQYCVKARSPRRCRCV